MYSVENFPCITNYLFNMTEKYNSQNQEKLHEVEKKCDGSSMFLMDHLNDGIDLESNENEVNHKFSH